MRILVISNSPWDDSNSFGSTFSNFFQGIEKENIASIYCSDGLPGTDSCSRFFRLSEKALAKSILKRNNKAGEEVFQVVEIEGNQEIKEKSSIVSFAKKHRWILFFWARELLWKLGVWKSQQLHEFIDSFQPDLIILPTYSFSYINKLALYIQKKWQLPMISYVSDDEYTLKQFSLSPLYWINRLYQRKWVKRGINNSKILYTISKVQKEDYEKCFNVPCKILTKFSDFDALANVKNEYGKPLRLIYTGNIGGNRWKSLKIISDALKEINRDQILAQMEIYTATSTTKRMRKALNIPNCSMIKGRVSAAEVKSLQYNADILVHVEALDLKNRLAVRQSFSTKLVDYFKMARPILAVGSTEVASLRHLIENDCAMVCKLKEEIKTAIEKASRDSAYLAELSRKAYECGRLNHNRGNIQKSFFTDLQNICEEIKSEDSANQRRVRI